MSGAVISICFVFGVFIGWNFNCLTDIIKELKRIADALEKK